MNREQTENQARLDKREGCRPVFPNDPVYIAAYNAVQQPHILTDDEAGAIALASGALEVYADMLRQHGHTGSADLALGHSNRLSAIYTRWALGRGTD
jgi:hypothetical protein